MKKVVLDPVEIVSLYKEGFSIWNIAELNDCSPTPVLRVLRNPEHNPDGMRSRRIEFDEDELVALYANGLSGEAAMEILGIPRTRGWEVLKDPAKNIAGIRAEQAEKRRQTIQTGKTYDTNGYVISKVGDDHPLRCMAGKSGWTKQHRLVMAEHIGRPLRRNENVHHINGIRDDNRIENLELWNKSQPSGIRNTDTHCLTCTCGKEAA